MIGLSILGGLVFRISYSMFSIAFDALIKILKVYRHQNPTLGLMNMDKVFAKCTSPTKKSNGEANSHHVK